MPRSHFVRMIAASSAGLSARIGAGKPLRREKNAGNSSVP